MEIYSKKEFIIKRIEQFFQEHPNDNEIQFIETSELISPDDLNVEGVIKTFSIVIGRSLTNYFNKEK